MDRTAYGRSRIRYQARGFRRPQHAQARIEDGALYGHEIGASISPLEADLGWIVKFDKGDFVGRDALLKQKENGLTRKLVGFEMRGRGIGRDGYEVHDRWNSRGLGHQRFTRPHAE